LSADSILRASFAHPRIRYTVGAVAHRPDDSALFEELAMPLFARLYNFACWLTQDRAAAEDLVQETYMKALKGFPSFQPGTNFRAWMYRILRNTFLTCQAGLKAAPFEISDDQTTEPEATGNPESLLLARMEREAIQRALAELPVHYREVILLCDFEEMSYQEIAQTIAVPIGTVMSRLSRARKAMRTLLAAQYEGVRR
jgi:RNA polymerase sigma-70 factor, ECF subfamily